MAPWTGRGMDESTDALNKITTRAAPVPNTPGAADGVETRFSRLDTADEYVNSHIRGLHSEVNCGSYSSKVVLAVAPQPGDSTPRSSSSV